MLRMRMTLSQKHLSQDGPVHFSSLVVLGFENPADDCSGISEAKVLRHFGWIVGRPWVEITRVSPGLLL